MFLSVEGAIYPNLQVPADFVKRYTERFGSDAQIAYAYNAYEFARVSLKLFSSSHAALPAEEIITLYSKGESSEAFSLDKTPTGATYFRYPLVIRRIRRGTFEDIE